MNCPLCQETLQMTDRQGVEIDYCPKCRGVWLDRGELQKLIDLSLAQLNTQAAPAAPAAPVAHYTPEPIAPGYGASRPAQAPVHYGDSDRRYDDSRYSQPRHDGYYGHGKPKKRESWFSELFDFD